MRPLLSTLLALGAATHCWAQADTDDASTDAATDAPEAAPSGILPIPAYATDSGSSPFLTGDWGGERTSLAERGIQFSAWWTQVAQGVVSGGRNETWKYGGKLDLSVEFDLDRMNVIPGGILNIHGESRYGNSVNVASGALLPINDVLFFPQTQPQDEDIAFTLTEVTYTQLFSKDFGVFLGKFVPLGGDVNEFAGGRGDTQFMSHSFIASGVTSIANPYSTLGGGVFYNLAENLTFTGNLYQTADSSTTSGFDNFGDGWTTDLGIHYQYRLGDLPGGFRAAFEYAFDGDYVNLGGRFVTDQGTLAIPQADDTWLVYGNYWQYLCVENPSDKPINISDGRQDLQGIGVFVRAGFADTDVNPVDWQLSAGLGGKGVLPGRDDDTLGIGYDFGKIVERQFATGTLIDTDAHRFEAYYNMQLMPSAELTFSAQYADSILARQDAATMLGLRLRLNF